MRIWALTIGSLLIVTLTLGGCQSGPTTNRPNEIVVSSANYALTPIDKLIKINSRPADVADPAPPPPGPPPTTQPFVFYPGEIYPSDLAYPEVCRQLEPALARKGFRNVADAAGHIADGSAIRLLLRVSYGERPWRDPIVRVTDLTWADGLVARRRIDSSNHPEGTVWDSHAGGDDAALHDIEQMLTNGDPSHPLAGLASGLIDGKLTEPYFLVVVDAFDLRELLKKKAATQRVWTTLIAVPRRKDQRFSDALGPMIEKAAAYFGETTQGRMRFLDDRPSVRSGELRVIDQAPDEKFRPATKP